MSKEDRVGSLWAPKKQNDKGPIAKGEIKFFGRVMKVVVWPNKWKAEDLQSDDKEIRARAHLKPDWYVELDKPREGYTGGGSGDRSIAQEGKAAEARKWRGEGVGEDPGSSSMDEAPF